MLLQELLALLVEPSSAQKKIIESYLAKLGVTNVAWVRNGADAFDVMSKETPDLVISAMHLEDMTGTELVQRMRNSEDLNSIPFMLVSSETHYRYLEPIRQAGVIAILPKPFEFEQLKKAMESTMHYIDPGEVGGKHFSSEELNVLLVDDSSTARKHIARVLRNMGIENIVEAENGVAAMACIQQQFFDLIVTDYNMPEMNGQELIERIRSESSQASVPVLMVSSESDDSRLAAVQQAGVSAICDKPFESSTVKELIERIL